MARVHWTQTPKGKALLAKRRAAKRQTVYASEKPDTSLRQSPDFAYALGFIECWIQTYAASSGLSGEALTAELGAVLSRKARR